MDGVWCSTFGIRHSVLGKHLFYDLINVRQRKPKWWHIVHNWTQLNGMKKKKLRIKRRKTRKKTVRLLLTWAREIKKRKKKIIRMEKRPQYVSIWKVSSRVNVKWTKKEKKNGKNCNIVMPSIYSYIGLIYLNKSVMRVNFVLDIVCLMCPSVIEM